MTTPHIQGNEEWEKEFDNAFVEMSPLNGRDMQNRPPLYDTHLSEVEEIKRFIRTLLTTKDQQIATAVEKERGRILKILDEMEDHTARNVVLYHLTLPTKDSI